MTDNNFVRMVGTVKRDASEGEGVLDFAIEVPNERGTKNIFDCRTTRRSDAWQALEGFVNEGETIEIIGHLEKRTCSEGVRVAGVWVDVRTTNVIIYVDNVVTEDENVD